MDLGPRLKAAYPKALATLIRLLGDFTAAEDALQDAVTRALEVWPDQGVPGEAAAWLVTTARRRHIDLLRHDRIEERHRRLVSENGAGDPAEATLFGDDMLRLVFTCCHPALAREAQTALTLRALGGLTVDEIARAFLVPSATIEQRITRAKRKIRDARIPYEIPERAEVEERQAAVLEVVYLIFNEGYLSTTGPELSRPDLSREAIRLARVLNRLLPAQAEAIGLLALMLLHDARRPARIGADGAFVPLDQQDRSLWITGMIAEGRALLDKIRAHENPGPYQIQAAIAAVHTSSPGETNWRKVARLYERLEMLQPNPVVRLNRAVAVSKAEGPEAGLSLLADLEASEPMQRYPYYHAARAALLADLGRVEEAASAYREALASTTNPVEQEHLRRKLRDLG